jgi:hypothetical protein
MGTTLLFMVYYFANNSVKEEEVFFFFKGLSARINKIIFQNVFFFGKNIFLENVHACYFYMSSNIL